MGNVNSRTIPFAGVTPRGLRLDQLSGLYGLPRTIVVGLVTLAVSLSSSLLEQACHAQAAFDSERVEAAGLRLMATPFVTIITDARDRADVDGLGAVFDLAVPQWCDYFGIPLSRVADWRIVACVMVDPERFRVAGLMPDDLPPFPAGFQRDRMVWLYVQPGDYYTRHLLLHEGTHAFMQEFLGAYGPPWYAEGMAELLAVHRWVDGQLQLRYPVRTREEVPWWGRPKLIRDDREAGRGLTLDDVLAYPVEAFRQVDAYGWAWAACDFLDRHPDTSEAFRALAASTQQPPAAFNEQLRESLAHAGVSWQRELAYQWQAFVDLMDYGVDPQQAIPGTARTDKNGAQWDVAFDVASGWVGTEIEVTSGMALRFRAETLIQVRDDGTPWLCDGAGVTLEYVAGRPLGELQVAVREVGAPASQPLQWLSVGRAGVVTMPKAGHLFFRLNEPASEWGDNRGTLVVIVEPESD